MKSRYPFIVAIAVIFIFCITTFMASMVEARGGRGGGRGGRGGGGGSRGGGGFSRSSPAAGGGFSSRKSTRQAPRQKTRREQPRDSGRDRGDRDDARADRQQNRDDSRDDRQQNRDDARDDRQDHRDDAREDRQDFIDDEWDDHHRRRVGAAVVTGVAIGAAASSNYVTYLPCNTTVFVSNVTYYHCGSTWYSRGSQGGEVVYIITSAPAGY